MKKIDRFVLLAVFFAAGALAGPCSSFAAAQEKKPNPVELVKTLYDPPSVPYAAQLVIHHSFQEITKAEEVHLYFSPPRRYRIEYLTPNGSLDRVVLTDGSRIEVLFTDRNGNPQKYTSARKARRISTEDELNLLMMNYEIAIGKPESVIGRSAWVVHLTPMVRSKPFQIIRVDQKTNVILEIKRYGRDESMGSVLRFVKFEPNKKIPSEFFLPQDSSIDPGFPSDRDHFDASLEPEPVPLPGGFTLIDAHQFQALNQTIRHYYYTDGLMPLSLFRTSVAVKIPPAQRLQLNPSRPLDVGVTTAEQIYHWKDKENDSYYTIMGDLPTAFLEQISLSLPTHRF